MHYDLRIADVTIGLLSISKLNSLLCKLIFWENEKPPANHRLVIRHTHGRRQKIFRGGSANTLLLNGWYELNLVEFE